MHAAKQIPIAGEKNLTRDLHSKAVTINDRGGYADYRRRRERAMADSDAISELRAEMDGIKSNISEMYDILKRLADNGSR